MSRKTLPGEYWKIIEGYPDYLVSNMGRVMRGTPGRSTHVFRILTPEQDTWGYARARLSNRGTAKNQKIHKLVAQAFLGSCPHGYEVNHKDSNKMNPALSNLEYTSRSRNMKHAFHSGRSSSG